MKNLIKSAAFFFLYYSGLEWLLARLIPVDAVAILMYHGVCDNAPMPAHINFHVERDLFERQMRALKKRYPILVLNDVSTALSRGERLKKGIVLSFDDGYRNNATLAAPVLKQLSMPFTVFLVTAFIGTEKWMPLNEVYWKWSQGELTTDEMTELRAKLRGRPSGEASAILNGKMGKGSATPEAEESFGMLSWDEVREMTKAGADFGSHTHTHCNMAVESEVQQKSELSASNELIQKHLGRPVRSFAYPYGYTSEVSRGTVKQAGYECALSTQYGLVTSHSDSFLLPRLGFDRRMWMFTGEIVYQFTKQWAKDCWRTEVGGRNVREGIVNSTEERHG